VDIVVIDSVAALVPRAEIEGEMGDNQVGLQARLMSKALRKIAGNIGKSGCVVIFLNQLRQKIGVTYGNPEVTTGGTALKFYASVRLDIRRIQTLKKGTEGEYGIRAKVKVAKIKSRLLSGLLNLILSSVKAFPKWVVCSISPNKLTWLLVKGHGIAIMAKILPRVAIMPLNISKKSQK